MDNVWAVICELNPFHLGHRYLVEHARKNGAEYLVAIMSGDFVQRGDPAVISKRARTEIALSCGFDLVLEIPSVSAVATAEKYALAGVDVANRLGCVDVLAFGAESPDLEKLYKISEAVTSPEFKPVVEKRLSTGVTFARARQEAIGDLLGADYSDITSHPNNILAVEYLKAIEKVGSGISAHVVKRVGAEHDDTEASGGFASSTFIRSLINEGNLSFERFTPRKSYEIILREIELRRAPSDLKRVEAAILYRLRTMTKNDFTRLPDLSEGLENRIIKAVRSTASLEGLLNAAKTKRYPMARIKRVISSAFLGIDKSYSLDPIPYIRVLGANKSGFSILKAAKRTCSTPIITRFSDVDKLDHRGKIAFETESRINDVYALTLPIPPPCGCDKSYEIVTEESD